MPVYARKITELANIFLLVYIFLDQAIANILFLLLLWNLKMGVGCFLQSRSMNYKIRCWSMIFNEQNNSLGNLKSERTNNETLYHGHLHLGLNCPFANAE